MVDDIDNLFAIAEIAGVFIFPFANLVISMIMPAR